MAEVNKCIPYSTEIVEELQTLSTTATNLSNKITLAVEQQQQQQQQQCERESSSYKKMKCEITKNYKNEADCTCKRMCMAKVSETMYIHQEHQEQEEQHKKNR